MCGACAFSCLCTRGQRYNQELSTKYCFSLHRHRNMTLVYRAVRPTYCMHSWAGPRPPLAPASPIRHSHIPVAAASFQLYIYKQNYNRCKAYKRGNTYLELTPFPSCYPLGNSHFGYKR